MSLSNRNFSLNKGFRKSKPYEIQYFNKTDRQNYSFMLYYKQVQLKYPMQIQKERKK